MNRACSKLAAALAWVSLGIVAAPAIAAPESGDDDPQLTATIAGLDTAVFDAYNRCDLTTFARYFSPKVEFYHDKGGVTWDRASVVASTKKWICGNVRRELLPQSLKVYPIKGFGAVEEGEHRFCQIKTGQCEGVAKFLMVWRNDRGRWFMTRVISYGHRPLVEAAR